MFTNKKRKLLQQNVKDAMVFFASIFLFFFFFSDRKKVTHNMWCNIIEAPLNEAYVIKWQILYAGNNKPNKTLIIGPAIIIKFNISMEFYIFFSTGKSKKF